MGNIVKQPEKGTCSLCNNGNQDLWKFLGEVYCYFCIGKDDGE